MWWYYRYGVYYSRLVGISQPLESEYRTVKVDDNKEMVLFSVLIIGHVIYVIWKMLNLYQ